MREPPMTKQTAVRLPDETFERLRALAERTGRTTEFHIRQAIEEHLDDLEAADSAEEVLERIGRGQETVSSLEDVERRLGLAD
jgi:RHH-type rel operon transcriptional repressor/antitoxin RelB